MSDQIAAQNPVMSEDMRVRLASSPDATADIFGGLANDPALLVRAALALNPAATSFAAVLARDRDERVRTVLALRLATLLPGMDKSQSDAMQCQVLTSLMQLVDDEAVRVRAAISSVVKNLPDAPHDLILRLAHDVAAQVADPVIRLSPLLTDEDLLGLLATPPYPHTATAVARRPGLNERVSDCIAAGRDSIAIQALLANQSAAIRETTLDRLIARASQHVAWHLPLVRRPMLSQKAARALSVIVSGHILAELAQRIDLPADLAFELQNALLCAAPDSSEINMADHGSRMDEAVAVAREMAEYGPITEEAVLVSARRGEARLCTALLAVATGLASPVVDRACTLRSAKGLISLIWLAGFSARCGPALQALLLRLPPDAILASDDGSFPLSVTEMRWQVEFLSRVGR